MKRSLALIFSAVIATAAFGAQAQDHHADPHGGSKGASHSNAKHAQASHGEFKENGKSHRYAKGQKLPSQFRGSSHYVSNYSEYHLSKPPKGHRWVRDDSGNFILVAVTTGLITEILSGH